MKLLPVQLPKLDVEILEVIEESVLVGPDVEFFAQLRDDQKCLPT